NITPAAADHLALGQQPTSTVAGVAISPAVTVHVRDPHDNPPSSDNAPSATVAIGTNPGSGTLSGTKTATVSGGVATFSTLSIDKTATGYTRGAPSLPRLPCATPFRSNITPAAADHLALGQQPTSTVAGVAVSPAVTV